MHARMVLEEVYCLLLAITRHIVALDVLQSKNAAAQVILLSYHSLPLVKVT